MPVVQSIFCLTCIEKTLIPHLPSKSHHCFCILQVKVSHFLLGGGGHHLLEKALPQVVKPVINNFCKIYR